MNPVILLLAASAVGVEAGWQPLPDGGHEYTIQIEPSLVSRLQNGHDIISDIPEQIHVRKLRITLGTGALSRIDGPGTSAPVDSLAAPNLPPPPADSSGDTAGSVPADDPFADYAAQAAPAESSEPFAERPPVESLTIPPSEPAAGDQAFGGEAASPLPPAADDTTVPANFEEPPSQVQPLGDTKSSPSSDPQPHDTQKPSLEGADPERPWWALMAALVVLACSIAGNIYLGWIARDARQRYRSALERFGKTAAA